jgi:glycosyltransferase involved in cell wall biosynthesis
MVDEFVAGKKEWAVSGLICVSEDLRRKVEACKPEHTKLCVIPSGVTVAEQSSSQEGPLKLVYVGRLVQKQKRVLDLVDALALILRKHNEITAALIGDGRERQAVQERIDHHALNQRIQVLGAIPSDDIQRELVKHHVLLLLSDYEGTPGAVMDGMAAGLVPVCLDIAGGVQELVLHEKTGLLVKDRGESFVETITRLSKNTALRQRLASNAKAHVVKNFSLEVATDRWETFCGELVKDKKEPSSVIMPGRYSLPPVRPGLDREDHRRESLPVLARKVLMRPFKRKFLNAFPGAR